MAGGSTLISSSSGSFDLSISLSPTSTSFSNILSSGSNNVTTLSGGPSVNTWSNISIGVDYTGNLLLSRRRRLTDQPNITTNSIVINGSLSEQSSAEGYSVPDNTNTMGLGAMSTRRRRRLTDGCDEGEF